MSKESSQTTYGRDNGNRNAEREEPGGVAGKSHEIAQQARQVAMERVDSVRETTQSAKQQAADKVRKLGATVRKVGEHLRVEDQTYIAQKAATASEKLDDFADYINTAELSTLVRDTGTLARTSPAAFFGSALLVGLAAGRFLKVVNGGTSLPTGGSSADRTGPRRNVSTRRETTR
jgi:hypothetical protein